MSPRKAGGAAAAAWGPAGASSGTWLRRPSLLPTPSAPWPREPSRWNLPETRSWQGPQPLSATCVYSREVWPRGSLSACSWPRDPVPEQEDRAGRDSAGQACERLPASQSSPPPRGGSGLQAVVLSLYWSGSNFAPKVGLGAGRRPGEGVWLPLPGSAPLRPFSVANTWLNPPGEPLPSHGQVQPLARSRLRTRTSQAS